MASRTYNSSVRSGSPTDPPPTVEDVETSKPAAATEAKGEEEKKAE
jgi:hypothetical protein